MRITLLLLFVLTSEFLAAQAVPVHVEKRNGRYTLIRNNEPYYIKGAGGANNIEELIYLGGNSIRTWGLDEADEALEIAQKNGMTVMLGFWVQHERHGFDYNDEVAVRKQLEHFKAAVMKYKDHPSLLVWGIGNEVDLFYSNTKVWDAIQDIAAMIHELDPNHPTTTVTAGLDSMEVQLVKEKAPDIDIYGMNTYGDIGKVPGDIRRFGWNGPYIIAEWGPTGHWEVEKTEWGAPLEQTSTEKAAIFEKRYNNYILNDSIQCIGSYVFLWGQKQETTATWYGLFTEDGDPTEPLDQLYYAWQNKTPENRAPSIQEVTINNMHANESIYLKSGESYSAEIKYSEPDSNKVKVEWFVYPESAAQSAGGDFEAGLQPELGVLKKKKSTSVKIVAPNKEGAFRLFVFVSDNQKRTAYANVPFYVLPRTKADAELKKVGFKPQILEIDTEN